MLMPESLLLTAARISTFGQQQLLTTASGFFFQRGQRLFLVTSRHVMVDEPSHHHPDSIEIELHTNAADLAESTGYRIMLYRHGRPMWRQGRDASGEVDVAVLEIDRSALPANTLYRAFGVHNLAGVEQPVEIGSALLVVGFPLGFHDTLHHMPVVRQAVMASSFGLRFKGEGYFLTDARIHRGTSGAPVVMRMAGLPQQEEYLPWLLLGIHSARLDVCNRDEQQDEALGLNCAWYADILLSLTD